MSKAQTLCLNIDTADLSQLGRGVSETLSEEALKIPSCRPTPLIGSWADESWPLNSRQASEIIAEQHLQRQRSSIIFEEDGQLIIQEDAEEENSLHGSDDVDDLHTFEGPQSEMAEQLTADYPSPASTEEPSTPTHVARCYSYDPYNVMEPYVLIHACYCENCLSNVHHTHHCRATSELSEQAIGSQFSEQGPVPPPALGASPISTGNGSFSQYHQRQQHALRYATRSEDSEWDAPRPRPSGFQTHTAVAAPPSMVAPATHYYPPNSARSNTVAPRSQAPVEEELVELSSFMPPPPPPRISAMVFEEEGCRNPTGIYYHIIMRWYSRVLQSQGQFVSEAEFCPAPDKAKYSFDQWADQASGWWYTHFEDKQKKTQKVFRRAGRM